MSIKEKEDKMVTEDINEYLIRKSYVNYKDRFYPKETTDLLTTSGEKMQSLLSIQNKYIENKKTGEKEDIGKSYFFENFNSNNLVKNDDNKIIYEEGKEPWRLMEEEENNRYSNNLNNNNLNNDNLKSIYMKDYTKKELLKNKGKNYGIINTFGVGDTLKFCKSGKKIEDPNKEYYDKMSKYLKKSVTGDTTYKVDYCELNQRKKANF